MAHTKRIAVGMGKKPVWLTTPAPGTHPEEKSITLLSLLRDKLQYAKDANEAKKIIYGGMLLVDGKIRTDYKFGVGIMDIISIPGADKHFRVMPGKKGVLIIKEIPADEAKIKLLKIINKSIIPGGLVQLNLHDGTNIVVSKEGDENPVAYNTKDTLLVDLKDKKIISVIEFNIGNTGLVIRGRHSGEIGKIEEILKGTISRKSLTTIGELQTLTDYVFMIGENESLISL
ncbi:MAG: 30S ribosomal protein S4e [Candidatus Altiarchaeales archaeon HGW-Altiarchaeales-3]|nr:MAG: 30S ribosomal protein S4e [Candidatus Altiarchaeales archaeon HGW-Altiarchaeales-3]